MDERHEGFHIYLFYLNVKFGCGIKKRCTDPDMTLPLAQLCKGTSIKNNIHLATFEIMATTVKSAVFPYVIPG